MPSLGRIWDISPKIVRRKTTSCSAHAAHCRHCLRRDPFVLSDILVGCQDTTEQWEEVHT